MKKKLAIAIWRSIHSILLEGSGSVQYARALGPQRPDGKMGFRRSEYIMPDDTNTQPLDYSESGRVLDPLGIIGWVIGGKYKIKSYLGGGGFGEVYEGYNENLAEQRLVLKFFKRVQAREKFAKEAKILCMLDHPNICRVIDYLPEEGAVVVAFIDGKDGGVILKESGALPEERFLTVARAMTAAIAYAHEKKIAHRDIKPGNIIIDRNDNVFLIDFGIAKEMGTAATKTAYTALTPMFAAPERQAGEKDYNPFLSDIYETGITLFNFATDSLPYRNPTNPDFNEWGGLAAKRLSPELTRILKKATHPSPASRYQSASEMADDLKRLPTAYGQPRRKSLVPAIIAVIAVVAIAGYFGLNYLSRNGEKSATAERKAVSSDTTTKTTPPAARPGTSQVQDKPATVPTPTQTQTPAKPIQQPPTTTAKEPAVVETKTPPKSTESAPVETAKPKEPPPPPPKSEILIAVVPESNATLIVGGAKRQINQRFEIDPGRYEAMVEHPDYPLVRRTINAQQGESNVTFDLAKEPLPTDTIDLQVALIPPTDVHLLELTRNGRKQTLSKFPYFGLKQRTGEWLVGLGIRGVAAAEGKPARVDSCAILPSGSGPRQVMKGNNGILRIVGPGFEKGSVARLLIYWTEK